MKFHHIGVACKNIDEEIVNISKIHTIVKQSPKVFDEQQTRVLKIKSAGSMLRNFSDGGKNILRLNEKNEDLPPEEANK